MAIQATYVSLQHITTHYTSEHTSTYMEKKRASESRQMSREVREKGQALALDSMLNGIEDPSLWSSTLGGKYIYGR